MWSYSAPTLGICCLLRHYGSQKSASTGEGCNVWYDGSARRMIMSNLHETVNVCVGARRAGAQRTIRRDGYTVTVTSVEAPSPGQVIGARNADEEIHSTAMRDDRVEVVTVYVIHFTFAGVCCMLLPSQ